LFGNPSTCIHSEKCWRGLSAVFNPKARPWINAEGAPTERIVEQASQCPSGALSTFMNDKGASGMVKEEAGPVKVEVLKNGPVLVHSPCRVINSDGTETIKDKQIALCRCGASQNKPYCDGSHRKIGFEG
jgi:uncharacterized Fe-S cluster protein YjdI